MRPNDLIPILRCSKAKLFLELQQVVDWIDPDRHKGSLLVFEPCTTNGNTSGNKQSLCVLFRQSYLPQFPQPNFGKKIKGEK